ncbi:GntR family transcriptional regulator [Enterococcus sp. HY326]|uniref:GntR family transcriptional regulator n=1 Tax=Enterococcus sp. HY326 TaxID=2971265 RepID=UPI00223EE34C|nr:GntR family transcriptional regulator [Enterococcus sp. HY326]
MHLIINHSSMVPIYEQIIEQIKENLISGELKENDMLPSIRSLAKDHKISSLTVKKAYDQLEAEGYTVTVHGKGSFIATNNQNLVQEDVNKEIETAFEAIITKAEKAGITKKELLELFEMLLEES